MLRMNHIVTYHVLTVSLPCYLWHKLHNYNKFSVGKFVYERQKAYTSEKYVQIILLCVYNSV